MVALHDLGRGVVAANLVAHRRNVAAALREEDYVRALKMPRRLAQDAARKHMPVAEGVCGVDKHDLYRVLELLVLETVVEDERVAAEALDRIAPRLHAVAIDDNGDAGEIRREHVRLVAAGRGVEKDMPAV